MFVADSTYKAPTLQYLLNDFAPWFKQAMFNLGFIKWGEERADCDDWADLYATMAKVAHKNTEASEGTALPVGVVWYRAPAGGHAIVVALCADAQIHFIEPQNGLELQLTDAERTSAYLVKV